MIPKLYTVYRRELLKYCCRICWNAADAEVKIVNGTDEIGPATDGAVILKAYTVVDNLFAARAGNSLYYCPGTLFFLDCTAADALLEKNIRFEAGNFIVLEGLAARIAALLSEGTEIVRVPDGTVLVKGIWSLNLPP